MDEEPRKTMSPALAREERLAAKLRENLRRRKAQARAAARAAGDSDAAGASRGLPKDANES